MSVNARPPNRLVASAERGDAEYRAGNERTRVDPVGVLDGLDDRTRIASRRDTGRDGPQGVALPHHVGALAHPLDAIAVGPEGAGDLPGADEPEAHYDSERHDPTTNVCSVHGVMVLERLFEVKSVLEHMFAPLPVGC